MISKSQISYVKSLHLKKNRDDQQCFIAEGVKTVLEIINQQKALIKYLYAEQDFIEDYGKIINENGLFVTIVTNDDLKKISLQTTPNKVLAVCNYFEKNISNFKIDANKLNLYLDDIRDPGNFGTIIRLASWFGVNTVFCSPTACDFYNPKVIQATMGAFLRVNCVYKELNDIFELYSFKKIYGAFLDGENLYREKFEGGLLVIGNEANGIQKENFKFITNKITIPSAIGNATESLNAASAASIILSEFYRQTN